MKGIKGRNLANKIYGKPVVNARRRLTLHISADDAVTGAKKDPGACAAAKAAMRDVPNCTMARIHLGRAYIFNKKLDHWVRYKTSGALRSEIIAFDRGGTFDPGEYDLRPMSPADLEPKSSPQPGGGKGATSKQKSPRKFHVTKGVRHRGDQERK